MTQKAEMVELDELALVLRGERQPEVQDPEEVARAITERILSASSVEEVFEQAGLEGWQDLLEVPVELIDVRFNRSAFEEGAPVYGVFDIAVRETGERKLVACGGRNVMGQAVRLKQLDALPRTVKLVEAGRETANGYRPLWLVPMAAE